MWTISNKIIVDQPFIVSTHVGYTDHDTSTPHNLLTKVADPDTGMLPPVCRP